MIELTIKLSDVDYDSLAELLLPALEGQLKQSGMGFLGGASSGVARTILKNMSKEKKDELLVRYLNANSVKLKGMLENMAAGKGVKIRVSEASAKTM